MSEDYWDGALWIYQADITNGAGGAGDQTYTLTVGTGNELEVLYGEVFNGDTSARVVTVIIDDGTNQITQILNLTAGAGARVAFPVSTTQGDSAGVAAGARLIVAGTMRIVVRVAAVALSQDSALGLACRIRGGVPSVVEAGASTPTININTEQVF